MFFFFYVQDSTFNKPGVFLINAIKTNFNIKSYRRILIYINHNRTNNVDQLFTIPAPFLSILSLIYKKKCH